MNLELFSGFILAGGKSSRMKIDKAFLEIGGDTFLRRAAEVLKSNCREIKVVINQNQKAKYKKAFPSFNFIFDIHERRGALGGVHAALKNCAGDWAIILAVDLPFVTSEAVKLLAQKAFESKESAAAIVPLQADGRLQPLCAAYRAADCLPIAEKLLLEKCFISMRDFLFLVPTRIIEASEFTAEGDLFFNVNYPLDLQALQ